ncbi:carboxymethylenebutenolidase [Fusarium sporotrichioides]|uniref:Carboxymethylenebutenolidase n=1 Tax=Fusarium sporotrichioides TaxID=5514 RepID=A0A395S013_FUSSP|nr:carboxymethylenebutenolidase [Fusarium sporotrichioides]
MFADITQPPKPIPIPQLKAVRPGVSLLPPLSRRGHGPGLVVLTPTSEHLLKIEDGVPSVLIKWAEEGYTVVQIDASAFENGNSVDILREALENMRQCDKYEGKIGLVAYSSNLWNTVAPSLSDFHDIVAAAVYTNLNNLSELSSADIPLLRHIVGYTSRSGPDKSAGGEYCYPKAQSYAFATPFHQHFDYNMESVSHTRNLQFLKPRVGGPYFDLEHIWEEHTHYEFADRSVEHTMSTMVQEPYVNHIPTLTGGIGRDKLSDFYRHNFIFNNSSDSELDLISRTVGIDRVVDEFLFKFTHNQEIPWMLPGVPPTNIKAEVPFTAVVNIRGDRLYHEHISWDQGTLLRQLGLLPEYLPFPYALPDGRTSDAGFEYRLPVAGKETAIKMKDRHAVASNRMFAYEVRERKG